MKKIPIRKKIHNLLFFNSFQILNLRYGFLLGVTLAKQGFPQFLKETPPLG